MLIRARLFVLYFERKINSSCHANLYDVGFLKLRGSSVRNCQIFSQSYLLCHFCTSLQLGAKFQSLRALLPESMRNTNVNKISVTNFISFTFEIQHKQLTDRRALITLKSKIKLSADSHVIASMEVYRALTIVHGTQFRP